VPADGTGAANYESGDFGTSPFFLGSSQASRGPPVSVYLWLPRAKHNGAARIYAQLRWLSLCWLPR